MKSRGFDLPVQAKFKTIFFFVVFTVIAGSFNNNAKAQVPQGFPYQAVARTATGNLMSNQTIQMRFSILDDNINGALTYQETRVVITNALGLFTHTIGQGTATAGSFNTINWGLHQKFLKVEMDTSGLSNYVAMGTTQLMSVPYALYASSSSNACAKNGLSKTGDSLSLGGALSENTTISLDGHDLNINNTAGSNVLSISQPDATNFFSLSQVPIAQTFTAITTSQLSSVEIFLNWIASSTATISISNANGTVLESETLTFSNIGTNWTSFTFAAHPLLQQGQVYTLSFTGSNGAAMFYSPLNPYAGGSSNFNSTHDFGFKIYVINNLPVLTTTNQNVGIGISTPEVRLDVNGQLKIRGGLPGIGKILTSDATGLASWQLPVSDSKWDYNGNDITNNNSGNVRIGSYPLYLSPEAFKLHVAGYDNAIKITGSGPSYEFGQLNFGDSNKVFLKEDENDKLLFHANRFSFLGNVGIGTFTPLAALHVENKNVLFSSPYPLPNFPGGPPLIGTGSYMIWYADKGAFRAGGISGTEWSNTNVGVNSFAAGTNCIARGDASTAIGGANIADGLYSLAAGFANHTIGTGSFATGSSNTITQDYGNCIGTGSYANGRGATTIGWYNVANGANSTVIGILNDSIVAPQIIANSTTPLFIIGNGTGPANRSNAMVVRNNGRVGLGNNANTYQLELSTNSAAKPSSSTWTISSDARLKNIDGNYTKGLSDIIKLNTILYHYKKENELKLPSDQQSYGFIAQEVQKIFPECVNQNEDGFLSLDLHPLFVSYVNAFKELNEKVEKQDSQMKELQIEIEQLKKLILIQEK